MTNTTNTEWATMTKRFTKAVGHHFARQGSQAMRCGLYTTALDSFGMARDWYLAAEEWRLAARMGDFRKDALLAPVLAAA
jgi:hypothetical protein